MIDCRATNGHRQPAATVVAIKFRLSITTLLRLVLKCRHPVTGTYRTEAPQNVARERFALPRSPYFNLWLKLGGHGVVRLAKYGLGIVIKARILCACMLTHVMAHPVKTGRPQNMHIGAYRLRSSARNSFTLFSGDHNIVRSRPLKQVLLLQGVRHQVGEEVGTTGEGRNAVRSQKGSVALIVVGLAFVVEGQQHH